MKTSILIAVIVGALLALITRCQRGFDPAYSTTMPLVSTNIQFVVDNHASKVHGGPGTEGSSSPLTAGNPGLSKPYKIDFRLLSNAVLRVQTADLKSEKAPFAATIQQAIAAEQEALANLNSSKARVQTYNKRTWVVVTDDQARRYTYDFWDTLSVLRQIKLRDANNQLLFNAAFYTNGAPRYFSTGKPVRYMELYETGELKSVSINRGEEEYYEVRWTADGKVEYEYEGTVARRDVR